MPVRPKNGDRNSSNAGLTDVRIRWNAWACLASKVRSCSFSENSVVSLVRFSRDRRDAVVMVFNFTPVVRAGYRIGVPDAGFYAELLNSDASIYGGGNVGNWGGVDAEPVASHGFEHSVRLTVPPLGCLLLKRR